MQRSSDSKHHRPEDRGVATNRQHGEGRKNEHRPVARMMKREPREGSMDRADHVRDPQRIDSRGVKDGNQADIPAARGALRLLAEKTDTNRSQNYQAKSGDQGSDPPTRGSDPPTRGSDPPTRGSDPPTRGSDPPTRGSDPPEDLIHQRI
nr:uncharacterized protein LOC123770578 [Procambarus clarkii]